MAGCTLKEHHNSRFRYLSEGQFFKYQVQPHNKHFRAWQPKGRPQQLQGKGDSCQDLIPRTSCFQIRECCKNNGIRDLLSSRHSVWLSQPAAQISLELLCELNFLSFVDDLTYMRLPRPGSRNAGYCSGVRAPEKR